MHHFLPLAISQQVSTEVNQDDVVNEVATSLTEAAWLTPWGHKETSLIG